MADNPTCVCGRTLMPGARKGFPQLLEPYYVHANDFTSQCATPTEPTTQAEPLSERDLHQLQLMIDASKDGEKIRMSISTASQFIATITEQAKRIAELEGDLDERLRYSVRVIGEWKAERDRLRELVQECVDRYDNSVTNPNDHSLMWWPDAGFAEQAAAALAGKEPTDVIPER